MRGTLHAIRPLKGFYMGGKKYQVIPGINETWYVDEVKRAFILCVCKVKHSAHKICAALNAAEAGRTVRAKRPVQQRKVKITCDCHFPCKDRRRGNICSFPVGDCSAQVTSTVA